MRSSTRLKRCFVRAGLEQDLGGETWTGTGGEDRGGEGTHEKRTYWLGKQNGARLER